MIRLTSQNAGIKYKVSNYAKSNFESDASLARLRVFYPVSTGVQTEYGGFANLKHKGSAFYGERTCIFQGAWK